MVTQQNTVFSLFFILGSKHVLAQLDEDPIDAASAIAQETFTSFFRMFLSCIGSPVPSQQFKVDNVKSFINSQGRTTVGSSPKLTSNRKFFANVVATREFKDMLDKDVDAIRGNFIKKMKYCDSVIMNQDILKDFYDREVDQTKI